MFQPRRILALDIGASNLRMAEFAVQRGGGLELLRYAIRHLGIDPLKEADQSAALQTHLQALMHECGLRPGPVLLSVSGKDVFPKYVKLPPVSGEKLLQIIRYEAQQNVPFPIDEVVWDYQLIEGAAGEHDVLLVAIKRDVVKKITDALDVCGLTPEIVDVSPMALYNAVRYNYPDLPDCSLVLDIGGRTSNLIFIEGNRIFNRSVPLGGNAITQELMREFGLPFKDAEDLKLAQAYVGLGGVYEGAESQVVETVSKTTRGIMTRLHAEISRSINFYRIQQNGTEPKLVLLTGGSSVIPHLDTFLKEKMGVDVDFLNPFQNVAVGAGISSESAAKDFHLLGEVTGLALRKVYACPVEVSLVPPEIRAGAALRRRQPMFAAAAAAVVVAALCWATFFARLTALTEHQLAKVTRKVGEANGRQRELDQARRERDAACAEARSLAAPVLMRAKWMEILDDVHARMRPGMWIVSVDPAGQESAAAARGSARSQSAGAAGAVTHVRIRGMGFSDKVDLDEIAKFRDSLRDARHFGPDVQIVKMGPFAGGDYAKEFIINMPLKEPIQGD